MAHRRRSGKGKMGLFSGSGIIILAILLALLGMNKENDTPKTPVSGEITNGLAFYTVDVGQGDGLILHTQNATVVIDGGEKKGADAMLAYLNALQITTVDCYVATHPHSDHIGAAPAIFDAFEVKNTLMTEFSSINMPTTATYEDFLNAVYDEGCEVLFTQPNDTYTFGDMEFTVLAPMEETEDYNNMSVVLKMEYGNNSFLLMGDAEAEVENALLDSGVDLSADVIKLGHHGSSSSSSPAFINQVKPDIALISCGADNKYGHPHEETVEMLTEYGIPFYRTDISGTVLITSNGTQIQVKENA